MSTTTINATGDEQQPERDPYTAYRTQYRALMSQVLDAMRRSLRLGGRR